MVDPAKDLSSSAPLSSISPERVRSTRVQASNRSEKENIPFKVDQTSLEEKRMLQELRARDREVRSHEAAHVAAGREFVRSGPSYTLQQGPDGRSYAIGGEVKLDTSPVSSDPEATIRKAEIVRQAALAPVEPSPQDIQVAANAQAMAARARVELAAMRRDDQPASSGSIQVFTPKPSPVSAFETQVENPSYLSQYA